MVAQAGEERERVAHQSPGVAEQRYGAPGQRRLGLFARLRASLGLGTALLPAPRLRLGPAPVLVLVLVLGLDAHASPAGSLTYGGVDLSSQVSTR
ncbi:hypothetical protein Sm713_14830 [Streptomyces sp. TS71-3]|nr:hypothetical protein Sm713_14830 [Streptomyces sp. TS71-3]